MWQSASRSCAPRTARPRRFGPRAPPAHRAEESKGESEGGGQGWDALWRSWRAVTHLHAEQREDEEDEGEEQEQPEERVRVDCGERKPRRGEESEGERDRESVGDAASEQTRESSESK